MAEKLSFSYLIRNYDQVQRDKETKFTLGIQVDSRGHLGHSARAGRFEDAHNVPGLTWVATETFMVDYI